MSLDVAPAELVKILAKGKARAVAVRHNDAIIIGADSVVVLGDKVLGKPADNVDAVLMLSQLSGKRHTFTTGFTIIDTKSSREITEVAETYVFFKALTDGDIKGYIDTGESVGHAGAYAIQGVGAMLVKRIEGEYTNIIGLPLAQLATVLKSFGVDALAQEKIIA